MFPRITLLFLLLLSVGCATSSTTATPAEPPPEATAITPAGTPVVTRLTPEPLAPLESDPAPQQISIADGELSGPPAGQYLLVEFWQDETGRGTCEPELMIDEPLYEFKCVDDSGESTNCDWKWGPDLPFGRVDIVYDYVLRPDEIEPGFVGLLAVGSSISGHGGGVSAITEPVNALPFRYQYYDLELAGLLPDGALAVQVDGLAYALPEGGSWVQREIRQAPGQPECIVTATTRVTYFGLLAPEQFSVGFDLESAVAGENQ